MRIGVPKEIKNHEYRVGLTPASVHELVLRGHQVAVESGAGRGIGHDDSTYRAAGATIVDGAAAVFADSELLIKVKEPLAEEWERLSAGQTLFTYLHLAADRVQAEGLMASGATAIAYETVTDAQGGLPLLLPMSEVAGRMSVQAGAHYLEKAHGGSGVLLGGVPGVSPGRVVILGGGVAGANAAEMALGLGACVTILERSQRQMRRLAERFGPRLQILYSTAAAIDAALAEADLVIGAVLIAGAAAPKLVTAEHLKTMRPGSVLVDIAIDQGGCFATSRPTSHDDPVYQVKGIIHYCVTNMPGAVPRTSTEALNNATLPFILSLADGIDNALSADPHLAAGLTVRDGRIVHPVVADALAL